MLFSSVPFLFYFLPTVLLVYFLVPKRAKNGVLLLSSLVFYGWGEPRYLPVMLVSILQGYIFGRLIERFRDTRRAKLFLLLSVLLSLGTLAYFKYADFMIANLNALTGLSAPLLRLALPVGISFYTFQILSYTVDVYRGTVPAQRNFIDLAAYIAMFPQLIAGPIVRYETVEQEIQERHESIDDVAAGLRRFILGLAKKVILANNIARIAETIYAGDSAVYGTTLYWLAAVAYALQIYFDFSGYSDMAIGLGRMFGFHFLENFDHPYTALSITDFWRRWHISLSTWFRDYVYIPLGGNRVKKSRWIRNILVVWALTGFWHGAQWNFLFWGLYYGLLLLAEKLFLGRLLERLPKAVRWLYTAFFVLIGWVLFDLTDFPSLCHALKLMFVPQATDWVAAAATNVSLLKAVVYLPLGIVCCLPLLRREPKSAKGILLANLASGLLLIVCIVFILSSSYNPFIYFRF